MRPVKNVRYLAQGEKSGAMPVFQLTIPYDKVLISDALGKKNSVFTMPTRIPMGPYFNVGRERGGKYVIHAGAGYFGMSRSPDDRSTLIHELTHVWQGEHSQTERWSGPYWFNSLCWQLDYYTADAYWYSTTDLLDWGDYQAEQQAQMVEDWYTGGMKKDPDADFRFYYVQKYIWGIKSGRDWLEQHRKLGTLPAQR
jgi:hypothetical protein